MDRAPRGLPLHQVGWQHELTSAVMHNRANPISVSGDAQIGGWRSVIPRMEVMWL